MPIHYRIDDKGKTYIQWGDHGHKYYYTSPKSERQAYLNAVNQMRAIYAHGYKGK